MKSFFQVLVQLKKYTFGKRWYDYYFFSLSVFLFKLFILFYFLIYFIVYYIILLPTAFSTQLKGIVQWTIFFIASVLFTLWLKVLSPHYKYFLQGIIFIEISYARNMY